MSNHPFFSYIQKRVQTLPEGLEKKVVSEQLKVIQKQEELAALLDEHNKLLEDILLSKDYGTPSFSKPESLRHSPQEIIEKIEQLRHIRKELNSNEPLDNRFYELPKFLLTFLSDAKDMATVLWLVKNMTACEIGPAIFNNYCSTRGRILEEWLKSNPEASWHNLSVGQNQCIDPQFLNHFRESKRDKHFWYEKCIPNVAWFIISKSKTLDLDKLFRELRQKKLNVDMIEGHCCYIMSDHRSHQFISQALINKVITPKTIQYRNFCAILNDYQKAKTNPILGDMLVAYLDNGLNVLDQSIPVETLPTLGYCCYFHLKLDKALQAKFPNNYPTIVVSALPLLLPEVQELDKKYITKGVELLKQLPTTSQPDVLRLGYNIASDDIEQFGACKDLELFKTIAGLPWSRKATIKKLLIQGTLQAGNKEALDLLKPTSKQLEAAIESFCISTYAEPIVKACPSLKNEIQAKALIDYIDYPFSDREKYREKVHQIVNENPKAVEIAFEQNLLEICLNREDNIIALLAIPSHIIAKKNYLNYCKNDSQASILLNYYTNKQDLKENPIDYAIAKHKYSIANVLINAGFTPQITTHIHDIIKYLGDLYEVGSVQIYQASRLINALLDLNTQELNCQKSFTCKKENHHNRDYLLPLALVKIGLTDVIPKLLSKRLLPYDSPINGRHPAEFVQPQHLEELARNGFNPLAAGHKSPILGKDISEEKKKEIFEIYLQYHIAHAACDEGPLEKDIESHIQLI